MLVGKYIPSTTVLCLDGRASYTKEQAAPKKKRRILKEIGQEAEYQGTLRRHGHGRSGRACPRFQYPGAPGGPGRHRRAAGHFALLSGAVVRQAPPWWPGDQRARSR